MVIVDSLNSTNIRDGKESKYIYRLLKNIFKESQAYGIEVERQDFVDGEIINIERDKIELISNNRYKVNELLRMLYKHEVSPIHLVDILGEYVDEYIYDFDDLGNQQVVN